MENSDEDIRKYGLRIYTIIKNGPLDKGGAKELSDFIIPSEEVMTRQMNFEEWVQTHANQEVTISLYSLLTKKFRDIKITTNPIGSKEGVLGASVKKENWTIANKKVLHITSVVENSFAQKELKLIPFEDYIIGVKLKSQPIIPLNQEEFSPLDILMEVIRKHKGNMMKFYIYNKNNGARDVTVTIGNDYYFTLGCEGAFGALHMFPSLDSNDNKIEETKGELIKENKKDEIISKNTQVDNKINVVENTPNFVPKKNETEKKIEKKEINENKNETKKEEDKKPDENASTTISIIKEENNNNNSTNEEQKIIENNKEEKKEEEVKINEVNNEPQNNAEQEGNKNAIIEEKSVEKEEENKVEIEEQKNENGDNTENKEENNNEKNEPKEEEIKTEEIKEENMLQNMIKYNDNDNENEEKKDEDIFGEENNDNTNESKNKKKRKKKK